MGAIIRFEDVSKKFIVHHKRTRSFQEMALHLFRRHNDSASAYLRHATAEEDAHSAAMSSQDK